MRMVNLNDGWRLRSEGLWVEAGQYAEVLSKTEGWMDVNVPCDVHLPLIENGLIQEPLEGENYKDCRWIEDRSWWFTREFELDVTPEAFDRVLLSFALLDSEADILLNDVYMGHHRSSFYPFEEDVKAYVRKGRNVIAVRLTSGLERYSEQDIAAFKKYDVWHARADDRGTWGDARRVFVRKAQYEYGWDHVPRLATCGILADVKIEF